MIAYDQLIFGVASKGISNSLQQALHRQHRVRTIRTFLAIYSLIPIFKIQRKAAALVQIRWKLIRA
ncbi:hypothetical protein K443DRAFT_317739 [Laccaria amethystina LaAM-08-1]|uniref:Uncharacterized protein n=1 Tax=Laccaria amethystina LaAM-08-1 TaxID=1095629 RepID=A0A0C9Y6R7_9AGAR|nr:hypothetical protein K443DRAFT_317739 [Laccaria amethystina LaAM-08-1]